MRAVLLALLLLGTTGETWAGRDDHAVEVQIVSETGRMLRLYPVTAPFPNRKAYAEAVRGDHYSILVRNVLNRRVGVVIAVDGRNIISGKKSWLRHDERMYILEPYARGEFKGWRTSLDSINRFYFTDVPDSYAAAFHDESAMGVIAVAVYPELQRRDRLSDLFPMSPGSAQRGAPAAKSEAENAGTGFGRQEHAPARVVAFEPEGVAVEIVYIKYEWRSTLCRLGMISCGTTPTRNRLWDDQEFAPIPPGRS